ncbi:MAG: NYN domain-containing protein [Proteobacteria bacterium]|nr:NYN domain-containing protein [Pseudomonadota bacterium]
MRKVVFMIDGWFMRKRIYSLKSFHYDGPSIRDYCKRHLREGDCIYRIFYYDTMPLDKKGHHPVTGKSVDFSRSDVAKQQLALLDSIKKTPNFALRLGRTEWRNSNWVLSPEKTKLLLQGKITPADLGEFDVRPQIEQKTVDMKIGLDIATVAIKRLADLLVIITGDEDVVPVLKFARTEGMQVCLDPLWNPISPHLSEHVDFVSTKIPNAIKK